MIAISRKIGLELAVALALALLALSSVFAAETPKPVRIGLSLDTLKEERWQRDRDAFVARAKELGAEVLVQSANNNEATQASQIENLLTQKIDVLVVVPHNSVTAAKSVQAAKKAGVKVVSYDRLVKNADVDLYVSFDNVEVGRLQAAYLAEKAPKGNYVLIAGSPTDNNAHLFRDGQMIALKSLVAKNEIKIVADQWSRDWQPSEALKHTENALTRSKNDVVAVVASNDGMAGGVISALKAQGLAGKVLVSGQDAELAACQRIVEGTQAMTVYKPIKALASSGAEAAVALARGQAVKGATQTVDNGMKKVPALLLVPVQVDKKNMAQTVIKDGFQTVEAVYKNVPRAEWPKAN